MPLDKQCFAKCRHARPQPSQAPENTLLWCHGPWGTTSGQASDRGIPNVITALFEFTRSGVCKVVPSVSASTDAQAVLLNWALMANDRAFRTVLDLPDRLVAELTWNERHDTAQRHDLDSWARRLDITVSNALRMSHSDWQTARPLAA